MTTTIESVHNSLSLGGCKPQFHRLDNECPQLLKDYFTNQKIHYQLASPHDHRSNAAERAIRTAKNHLAAGWWSTDDAFPMHLWDQTITQAELTLNLLRGLRINPKLSAWEQIHGRFDYNRTPFAPPGIKVLIHETPDKRGTWSDHAIEGWYVGPAFNHYQLHTVYCKDSGAERTAGTLTWLPERIAMPIATPQDMVQAAIQDLTAAIQHPV